MPVATAALVSAIGSAVIGGTQLAVGAAKKKKGRGLTPEAEQPEARLELARMKRQAKAYETGKAYTNEYEQLQNVQRQQNINAARLSGGAAGAAIGGSARNALATNSALLKLAGQGRQVGLAQRQQATQQLNKMLQRKDDLQLLQQSQLYAEAAKLNEAGMGNMSQAVKYGSMAAAGSSGGGGEGLKGMFGGGDSEGGDESSSGGANLDADQMAAIAKVIMSIGCWIAREVYGNDNYKWLIFRYWLFTDAPNWFYSLYMEHGEKFAKLIKTQPKAKEEIKTHMDKAVNYVLEKNK